ncbi:hypothetical protein M3I54_05745 [Paraburkholderia sp. CNPSo 3274]|uniref:hypothetical protein n=1 Tax=Paraburkholderia sp. CNPSo 3274 TaxID=2940932 RepID=UPI0020B87D42|nr:hypothetical protein [Paraburkholderia sp. CNPSo 3274]MCP3706492.1 hypothetical protein [Paraburkholderia sp. CNPSo 3274]
MKYCFLMLAACLFTNYAYSKSAVELQVTLDQCNFNLSDPYNGKISIDNESTPHSAIYTSTISQDSKHPFDTKIKFDCHTDVDASNLSDLSGASKKNGKWMIDAGGDAGAVNTKLYLLQGKGWDGAGITQDQTFGDEDRRTRGFTFCLVHGTKALCGLDDTVMYLAHPNETVLPQIIRLLNSIRFLN